jgi:hypothetical protein
MESLLVLNDRKVDPDDPTDPRQYDHYLAGPMSGYPKYNYPAFTEATILLRQNGFVIHSPHEAAWPEGHDLMMESDLWEYMMRKTKKLLIKSNSIILMAGWASSTGAKLELHSALDRNYRVFTLAHGVLSGWNKEYVHAIGG